MDELDGHRPFADGGGAAFGRAGADVAGREHAGDVGLEQVVAFAAAPVRMKPSWSRPTVSSSHSVHGSAPRKRNRNEKEGARRS